MTLAAYTENCVVFPQYINVSLDGDEVVFTIRPAPVMHADMAVPSEPVSMRMPRDILDDFCNTILDQLFQAGLQGR